jgi:hypothetical protein
LYLTTPVTVTADYEFNIESAKPLRFKMSGVVQAQDYVPGQGCIQYPQPRMGPKTFWDPADSSGGRITFRLYPVSGGCP